MSALKKIKGLVKEARTYSDAIKLLSKEKDIPTLKSFIDFAPLHKSRKLSVEEYIKYRFDKCGEEFRSTFLPYDKASEYWQVLNPYKYASLARDKFIGHALMSELGIPTSKLYFAYNKEADGNGIWVNSLETAREMIQAIDDDRFIVKPSADSAHGQGVGVYCKSDDISFVAEGTTTMLFEGLVKQSGQMSSLNSSSVNTRMVLIDSSFASPIKPHVLTITISPLGSSGSWCNL